MNKFIFLFLFLFLFIPLVTGSFTYNNPSLPKLDYEAPVISFNNNTGAVNTSAYANCWSTLEGVKCDVSDITYDEISGGDVNALGYYGYFNGILGIVGSLLMDGSPWYLSGTDLEINQDLQVNNTIVENLLEVGTNIMPTDTLNGNIGSGALRWLNLFVQNINAEEIDTFNLIASENVTANYGIFNNLDVTGNATINNIYGEMWYYNQTATELNFAIDGEFYNIFMTNATNLNGFTFKGGHMQTSNLTAQHAGIYKASFYASGSGQNNHIYETAIFIDGVEQKNCGHEMKMAAGDDIVTHGSDCLITLNVGSVVDIRTADVGGTGTGNYYDGNLNLVRIGN
jgi:hypothetical protein